MSMNFIAIHGRLTSPPEMRQTQSGISVCNFTVAVDRNFTRKGEEKQTDFVSCVAWQGLADHIGRWFTKGKEIIVVGELQSRKWQDKDGNNRVSWEIQAQSVDFCGSKGDSSSSGYVPAQADSVSGTEGFAEVSEDGSDLPF